MFELSLNENEINFKSLETKIYKFVCNETWISMQGKDRLKNKKKQREKRNKISNNI
ncbi:hypothetical protein [Thermoanaerobacterium sp. RBIITD]|uniref:hypothetical protein n=1 Tax=Thermoanaerobacterium sp. RBIITD TaxID=1550240 RepID=UPI000BC086FE|nr:hypothetical protein [Thermoanaerobacterium sp. RBIITD]SNX52730.1 hypothetical protein SAMN05660242_0160 [Thermoanaerobacterium sp. RBIITD]